MYTLVTRHGPPRFAGWHETMNRPLKLKDRTAIALALQNSSLRVVRVLPLPLAETLVGQTFAKEQERRGRLGRLWHQFLWYFDRI